MPNKKISQLPEVDPLSGDTVPIARGSYTRRTTIGKIVDLLQQYYVHNQGTASASWSITHNLNKYPSVMVVDSGNNVVEGDIKYDNLNNITITFSAPFSGNAYLT